MKTRIVAVLVTAAVCAEAVAADGVVDPGDHPSGTNIAYAVPGVTTRYLRGNPGATTSYLPIVSEGYTVDCTSGTGACSSITHGGTYAIGGFGPLKTLTAVTGNLHSRYIPCYAAHLAGRPSGTCAPPWSLVEFEFDDVVGTVSVDFAWRSDAPVVIAYNAAGVEVKRCMPSGLSSPTAADGCMDSTAYPGYQYRSRMTVHRPERDIVRVVAGSLAAAAVVNRMEFSDDLPACQKPGGEMMSGR